MINDLSGLSDCTSVLTTMTALSAESIVNVFIECLCIIAGVQSELIRGADQIVGMDMENLQSLMQSL